MRTARARSIVPVMVGLCLSLCSSATDAQDIEPRSYSNAPVGVNFLIAGYAYTRGGLSLDPALPVSDVHLRSSSLVAAYARALDLWGVSGKFDIIAPYTSLTGSAEYAGQPVQRDVSGLTDARVRLSANFYGAPALAPSEFRSYQQDLIVGASLQVSIPWGQYDDSRVVNLGNHRWSFKPELGASKSLGPWTLEFAAGATFYTDNRDFYGGRVREQRPLYSFQGHAIYGFASGAWSSLDATYFAGGRTTVDGLLDNNLQSNWRVGATLVLPVDVRNSVKLYASSGVWARTGNNYDLISVAWQYRWGGGI